MPIYEYACRSCEHRFESIQKASEAPLRDCPECGEATLKKLLSAPVFRLKGSGWYETDFKTGDKRNVAETGDAGEGGKDGDATKSGDKAGADKDAGKAASEAGGSGSSQDKAESKPGANGGAKPAKVGAKDSSASKAGAGGSAKPTKPKSSKG